MPFVFKSEQKNMTNLKPSNFNLGLIGYPLSHSKSPELHQGFLAKCGLKGEYTLYPIPPNDEDALSKLLDRVRTGEIHGLNVTIPHKQNVIPLLDELSDTARTIGAVNTISLKNGILIGDNTDAPGFWKDLQNLLPPILAFPQKRGKGLFPSPEWERDRPKRSEGQGEGRHALILGSGGAARAVVYALLNAGWQVTLATRHADLEQAQTLIEDFTSHNPEYTAKLTNLELQAPTLYSLLPTLSLIVNATPVGMKSHHAGSPWIKNLPFPPNAVLYDLIYNPSKTQLMEDAEKAGVKVRGGIGMLEAQAMLSFEIWTGCKL